MCPELRSKRGSSHSHQALRDEQLNRTFVEHPLAIVRVLDLGVGAVLNHNVVDIEKERHEGRFDAVFLAVGAQLGKRVNIPAGDSARILDAVALLHQVADDNPPLQGRRIVACGRGDTALDAAPIARRLGSPAP